MDGRNGHSLKSNGNISVPDAAHPRFREKSELNKENVRIALIQLSIVANKTKNIANFVKHIFAAKSNGADVVILPELDEVEEDVISGAIGRALSDAAREAKVWVVGGVVRETENGNIFNTATIWNSNGEYFGKHRQIHLRDMNAPVAMKDTEEAIPIGDDLTIFQIRNLKIGLGIGDNFQSSRITKLYANAGCSLVVYLTASDVRMDEEQWELLGQSESLNHNVWVAVVSPARNAQPNCPCQGLTSTFNPLGQTCQRAGDAENIIYEDIEKNEESMHPIQTLDGSNNS